jgi:tetratricopeptide (TPR) repeat protein
MKRILLALIVAACCNNLSLMAQKTLSGQVPKSPASTPVIEKDTIPMEVKIYQSAILFGDYEVARTAVFSLLTRYPARIDYLDTLARLYYSTGSYSQALLAASIYLEKNPDNLQLMELSAICQGALNNNKESLEMYEKVYAKSKSIYHAYQVGVLQYTLKRYGECELTVNKLISDPESGKEKIQINVDQQKSQEVLLSAAAYNLRGVLQKDQNKPDKAKEDFESALKIAPDFVLAKNNLESLKLPAAEDKDKKKK